MGSSTSGHPISSIFQNVSTKCASQQQPSIMPCCRSTIAPISYHAQAFSPQVSGGDHIRFRSRSIYIEAYRDAIVRCSSKSYGNNQKPFLLCVRRASLSWINVTSEWEMNIPYETTMPALKGWYVMWLRPSARPCLHTSILGQNMP